MRRGPVSPRAFTLIEMMVTIAIIALLISLVVVAGGRIRAIADDRQTNQILVSVKTGIEQFRETYGYYPPLLDDRAGGNSFLSVVSDDDELKRNDVHYYSTLSLVPYLVGIGDINLDGNPQPFSAGNQAGNETDDNIYDDGFPGEGFRDPGRDRSWGGSLKAQNRTDYWTAYENASPDGKLQGKVQKRLIELNESILPAVDREGVPIDEHYLFQINDIWDRPIRYYRGWDVEAEKVADGIPEDWPREWFASVPAEDQESLISTLRSAPYVLLSSGRDRIARPEEFEGDVATAENDKDNILEIGE